MGLRVLFLCNPINPKLISHSWTADVNEKSRKGEESKVMASLSRNEFATKAFRSLIIEERVDNDDGSLVLLL